MKELEEIKKRFVDELDNWLLTGDEDAKEDFQYSSQEIVMKSNINGPLSIRQLYEKITGHELSLENTLRHPAQIKRVKDLYKPGTKLKLIEMKNDPRPIEPGTIGTVNQVDDIGTVHCVWPDGRLLGLVIGVDDFEVLK